MNHLGICARAMYASRIDVLSGNWGPSLFTVHPIYLIFSYWFGPSALLLFPALQLWLKIFGIVVILAHLPYSLFLTSTVFGFT